MNYTGVTGRKYTLGKDIAQGGEGTVYTIVGDAYRLAKIYHPKPGSVNMQQEKILNMVKEGQGENFQYIAWPLDVLYDESYQVRGFVMKKYNGVKSLADQLPERNLDWQERVTVAHNLCDVVREIHGMQQCIGDMNPSNFGVDPTNGHVYAFDADSFHYRAKNNHFFPCVVGLPEYYAPELQRKITRGQDMRTLNPAETFSVETDRFALAVLIFQLLFAGYHPFTARLLEHYGSSTVVHKQSTNILNKTSPYFNPQPGTGIPVGAPPLSIIPDDMKELFRRAFLTEKRPTAVDWQRALFDLLKSLKKCTKNHYYYNRLNQCPWCSSGSGNSYYVPQYQTSQSQTTRNNAAQKQAAVKKKPSSATAAPVRTAPSVARRKRYLYEKALWWWNAIGSAMLVISMIGEAAGINAISFDNDSIMNVFTIVWVFTSFVPAVLSFIGRPYDSGGKEAPNYHWLLVAIEGLYLFIGLLMLVDIYYISWNGIFEFLAFIITHLILTVQLIRDR